jgi:hypothetical protein
MEWTYLYYIAVLSAGYVSFTSIFLALRQIIGAAADRAAGWSTRYLIAVALCTIMAALLPPLLVIFGLLPVTAIRLSALVALVLLGRLDGIYLWRRSSVFGEGMDLKLTILYSIAVSVDVAFGAIACGLVKDREFAAFCAAETAELAIMFRYFSASLERFLPFQWEGESGRRAFDAPR